MKKRLALGASDNELPRRLLPLYERYIQIRRPCPGSLLYEQVPTIMNFIEACEMAKGHSIVAVDSTSYVYSHGDGTYGGDWLLYWIEERCYKIVRTYLNGKDITYDPQWNSPFMKLPPSDIPLVLVDRHGKEFEGLFDAVANLFMRPFGTTSCGEMFIQAPSIVKWRLK